MDYGDNMKPTKVKPADLDRFKGDSFWGKVLMKLKSIIIVGLKDIYK